MRPIQFDSSQSEYRLCVHFIESLGMYGCREYQNEERDGEGERKREGVDRGGRWMLYHH